MVITQTDSSEEKRRETAAGMRCLSGADGCCEGSDYECLPLVEKTL